MKKLMMKIMATTLAAMIVTIGLVLAGSEIQQSNIILQFAVCSTGICLMVIGGWWIAEIHKGN